MNFLTAIETKQPIKRVKWKKWYKLEEDKENKRLILKCVDDNSYIVPTIEDITEFDWVVKRKDNWWKDEYRKKYPNGILCWVWNYGDYEKDIDIIIDCDEFYFYGIFNNVWDRAVPFKSDEKPVILEEIKYE